MIGQVPTDSSREHRLWKPNETERKKTFLIGEKLLTHKIFCVCTRTADATASNQVIR
jgi:hypothetical protein